jgi:hypothetical protein
MTWSTVRTTSTWTPTPRMMWLLMSMSAPVFAHGGRAIERPVEEHGPKLAEVGGARRDLGVDEGLDGVGQHGALLGRRRLVSIRQPRRGCPVDPLRLTEA